MKASLLLKEFTNSAIAGTSIEEMRMEVKEWIRSASDLDLGIIFFHYFLAVKHKDRLVKSMETQEIDQPIQYMQDAWECAWSYHIHNKKLHEDNGMTLVWIPKKAIEMAEERVTSDLPVDMKFIVELIDVLMESTTNEKD